MLNETDAAVTAHNADGYARGEVIGTAPPNRSSRLRRGGVGILANVGRDVSAIPAKGGANALLTAAGLDWEVQKREVFVRAPSGELVHDEHAVALTRSDTGQIFGYASPAYQPAQNRELAELYSGLLGELGLQWQRAGFVRGGSTIFVLAKVVDVPIVKGDESEMFLLLQNGHDTTSALKAAVTFNRLFCANQLPTLEREGNAARFRHNGLGIRDLATVVNRIRGAIEAGKSDAEAFRLLASRQCSRITPLLDAIYPVTDADGKRAGSARLKARDQITELFDGKGAGLDVPGVRGTWWAAFNAITEYEDHHASRRSDESALFGAAGQRKVKALEAAIKLSH
jgi:phage/plasmid-like protein (TIGR03299 family)